MDRLICIVLCICFTPIILCQNVAIYDAISNGDAESIIKYVVDNPSYEEIAVDALCSVVSIDDLSYEEIAPLHSMSRQLPLLSAITGEVLAKRELEIFQHLKSLSIEDIEKYKTDYPSRVELINTYIEQPILNNLASLSYLELIYLKNNMPDLGNGEVKRVSAARKLEKKQLMADNVSDYMASEYMTSNLIQYDMEKVIMKFFIEAHKQLTKSYSKIPLVPDDPAAAAKQYQELVKICFSSKKLQELLQQEVDKYSARINKARDEYARIAGVNDYPKFDFKVPLIKYNSRSSCDVFAAIPNARRQYVEDRETSNNVSGVVGFLFGGIWGLGVKALGDWDSISTLVEMEYSTRHKYVDSVYEAIYNSFKEYSKTTTEQFQNTLMANENMYIQAINQ